MNSLHPHVFTFNERNSGISPKKNVLICDTPLDCFELLLGEKLIDFIVEEMNNYREQHASSVKPNRDSHKQDGLRRIVRKYSCFLAVIMLMTITRKYKIHDN